MRQCELPSRRQFRLSSRRKFISEPRLGLGFHPGNNFNKDHGLCLIDPYSLVSFNYKSFLNVKKITRIMNIANHTFSQLIQVRFFNLYLSIRSPSLSWVLMLFFQPLTNHILIRQSSDLSIRHTLLPEPRPSLSFPLPSEASYTLWSNFLLLLSSLSSNVWDNSKFILHMITILSRLYSSSLGFVMS